MKKIRTRLKLCLLLAVCVLSVPAFAAKANVTYSDNAGEFIFAPGSEYSPTDLFPSFKDVMPGDTLTQRITVKNDADKKVKVKIYLRSLGPTDKAYKEFLDRLHLTVRKAEETPMFDAAADKTEGLTEWVCLGTLYSGGKVDLDVRLEVPAALDDRFQNEYGEIEWQFMVEELPTSPDDPQPPKTGDDSHPWLWIIVAASAVTAIVITGKAGKSEKRAEH